MKPYLKEIVRRLTTEPNTKFIETLRYVYYIHGVDDMGFAKLWRCDSYLFHHSSYPCYHSELIARIPHTTHVP